MAALNTGIQHIRDDAPLQSATGAEMSVIGLIGIAPDADPVAFPLNTNVLVSTADSTLRALLGPAGTIENALKGISAQLGADTSAARVIVRRVAPGVDDFAAIANMVGSESLRTGVWGFLDAAEEIGLTPRLLIAPGYTHQTKDGVVSVTVGTGGTGYTSAPAVGFTGGAGNGAAATAVLSNGVALAITTPGTGYTVAPTIAISAPPTGGVQATATVSVTAGAITAINITNPGFGYLEAPTVTITGAGTGGVITATLTGRVRSVTITNPGTDYTSAPTITFTGGGGTLAAATSAIGQTANAICAIMPTICDRMRANFIPEGPTTNKTAWVNWLETLPENQHIFHPLAQVARVLNDLGATVSVPLSPYMAGLYVRRDNERDGVPSGSIANQPINGIVGVLPRISLSLIDASSPGQDYLERRGGIVARGESGVEGAVSSGGFSFWGYDTMSATSDYAFAHVVRMRDYMELSQVTILRPFLGRQNITLQVVQAIVNSMEDFLFRMETDSHILGYRVRFEKNRNTPSELRLGHLDLTFEAEEPPAIRKITVRSRRYEAALQSLVQQLAITLNGDLG